MTHIGAGMPALDSLENALVELDEEGTLTIARQILAEGTTPTPAVIGACQQAMRVVGERYERHEYYLAGLILAGEIFKEVLELVQPREDEPRDAGTSGIILLATVKGDIHDIGKNLFASTLRGYGFEVVDLGVDVPKETIVEAVRTSKPDVVCLSGLITTAFQSMKATVDSIRAQAPSGMNAPPIVLGGGTVDDQICRFAGADSWSSDAIEGVRICLRLVEQARQKQA
jgi:methanogenic corrinoid protein MtbC1